MKVQVEGSLWWRVFVLFEEDNTIHISKIKDIAILDCTNIVQLHLMIQKEKRKMKRGKVMDRQRHCRYLYCTLDVHL